MDYNVLLRVLPTIAFVVALGAYCLILVRSFRQRARLGDEEANLRKRIADNTAV
jgi:hypothetical protein